MKCIAELKPNCSKPNLMDKYKKPERTLLSVFMRLLELVPELRAEFLAQCGYGAGKTCTYDSYMEATFPSSKFPDHRPDGLMTCQRGTSSWSALVEAKCGKSAIRPEQIQDYAHLASLLEIDCILTLSNEFARQPTELPYHVSANKRRKREIYHFAWADVRGLIDRFSTDDTLSELQRNILKDAATFLWDTNSGISTFDQMPKEWGEFVQSSGVGVGFSSKTPGITEIVHAWHQERRDLRSKLVHTSGSAVDLRHELGVRAEFEAILAHDRKRLAEEYELFATYYFKESRSSVGVLCELQDRKTTVTADIACPPDKGAKATVSWLARQLEAFDRPKTSLVLSWKGKGNERFMTLDDLQVDPVPLFDGFREAPRKIRLIRQVHDVRRFRSPRNFIVDLEGVMVKTAQELRGVGLI